jgi:uncharacterized protein YaiI (UPF0178 family)
MQIWIDADACPKVVKEIIYRAAQRARITVTLVANQPLSVPRSPFIKVLRAAPGFDQADKLIIEHLQADDLVVTADIPLAAQAIEKGATALNPRGEAYDRDNIRERLTLRNFMEELRSTGQTQGGPPPLNLQDRHRFANNLDRWLARSR